MVFIYFISISLVGLLTNKVLDFNENSLSLSDSPILESLIKSIAKSIFSIGSFVIQQFIFFVCLSIFETTGYMARISILFDKFFYLLGLSGKSLIPFITATGCSAPAIMNTCTIKNDSERKTTIVLIPFIPCSAKMNIISFSILIFSFIR